MLTDERTNGQTDERTRREHAFRLSRLAYALYTDKNSIISFADGIAFVCFYDAERVLAAIAKFLVHLLGKWRGGVKWQRRDMGRKRRGKREVTDGRTMELHEQNSPRMQHDDDDEFTTFYLILRAVKAPFSRQTFNKRSK